MEEAAKNEMEMQELEDLAPDELAPDANAAPPAPLAPPAPVYAPPPLMVGPAHKQLYQFLWSGIAVVFGCLLPFNNEAAGWIGETFQPELQGPIGLFTVGGSVYAFFALLFVGAQLHCIKYRTIMLKPLVPMLLICASAWINLVGGFAAADQFGAEGTGLMDCLYKKENFVNLFRHLGPGYLFVVGGSTYSVLVFFQALLGVGSGKKKTASTSSSGGGKGRARGRRR